MCKNEKCPWPFSVKSPDEETVTDESSIKADVAENLSKAQSDLETRQEGLNKDCVVRDELADNGSQSPTKYHENGHDTFSDFVTLVCQEAQSTQPSTIHHHSGGGGGPRSPKVTMAPSYFSSSPHVSTESSAGSSAAGLYPPPPQAPSARPVALIRSSGTD